MEGNFNDMLLDNCMADFNETLMDDYMDFDASLICISPSRVVLSPEKPGFSLWSFSDENNDAFTLSLVPSPPLPSCNLILNSVTENPTTENDDNRRVPSPFLGLVPIDNADGYCVLKERMTQALRYIKESIEQQILAQIWAPVKNGGRYVLTTSGQPFVLDPDNGLPQYRMVSLMYMFSVDGESDGDLGLPGRVFWQKLPEWTPNVQYYSHREESRLDHALHYNVQGTLALPVLEPSGNSCVGVLELIMTSPRINYAPEVDKICKALEAVNLKSSDILDRSHMQICNEGRQNALAEILEILTVVCETHKFPLAQTWVPCRHHSSFDGSCIGQVCMSTTDVAFYVVDAHMWGFREACVEHHLQKGQGVSGRAFLSHNSCFCRDITQFCKTEYPLVHYARMFGLTSCFAICLRSSHTGDDDYILEFFLPHTITDNHEQETLLGSLLATMKHHIRSLSGKELETDDIYVEIFNASSDDQPDTRCEFIHILQSTKCPPGRNGLPDGEDMLQVDSQKHQLVGETNAMNNRENVPSEGGIHNTISYPENEGTRKTPKRKITLEDLQHFSGSRKDAAKHFGVSVPTIKRCLRDHKIKDWRNRKIDKKNQCLTEPKDVIESFQGEGAEMGNQMAGGSRSCERELNHEQIGSYRSQIGVGLMEESSTRLETTPTGSMFASLAHEQCIEARDHADAIMGDRIPVTSWTNPLCFDLTPKQTKQPMAALTSKAPHVTVSQEMKSVTIKATYREDVIRFRISLTSGIMELKEEVTKRLKLEVGTLDIKYLDDDHEWVLMVCDADLQECLDISRSSGSNMIRLLVS